MLLSDVYLSSVCHVDRAKLTRPSSLRTSQKISAIICVNIAYWNSNNNVLDTGCSATCCYNSGFFKEFIRRIFPPFCTLASAVLPAIGGFSEAKNNALIARYITQQLLYRYSQNNVEYESQKNHLDFGGNRDHVTIGLRLWLHFTPVRTVLR